MLLSIGMVVRFRRFCVDVVFTFVLRRPDLNRLPQVCARCLPWHAGHGGLDTAAACSESVMSVSTRVEPATASFEALTAVADTATSDEDTNTALSVAALIAGTASISMSIFAERREEGGWRR